MSEEKTHWKTLRNPDYFGSHVMLQLGSDLNVKITSVKKQTITLSEGKAEEHTIAQIEGQKPWILNSINQKAITRVLGSPYIEDWVGKTVTVYSAKIRAFGENMDAVRVRDKVATEKPKAAALEMNPTADGWEQWRAAIVAGTTTITELKKHYAITAENEKLIKAK